MAEKATKAVPAMAVAGVLVAAPAANAATRAPTSNTVVIEQVHPHAMATHQGPVVHISVQPASAVPAITEALVVHHEPTRHYTVQPGNTLSSIAEQVYGDPADWRELYEANRGVLRNPNMIFPGEVLDVPGKASGTTTAQTPPSSTLTTSSSLSGTLSCSGLEELWQEAGGSHAEAFMAAEIAMAESSGEQFATGTVGERGYWQINPNHGALSTYNPLGNAKAAVILSDDGTDWDPWTTFTSGAFRGRC